MDTLIKDLLVCAVVAGVPLVAGIIGGAVATAAHYKKKLRKQAELFHLLEEARKRRSIETANDYRRGFCQGLRECSCRSSSARA